MQMKHQKLERGKVLLWKVVEKALELCQSRIGILNRCTTTMPQCQ